MTQRYGADLLAWIFIGVISSIPWLAVLGSSLHGHLDAKALLIAIGASAFSFVWLLSFRIILTPTEVVFRSLFGGRQSILHSEIKKVRLTWSPGSTTRGPWRLIIEPREGSGAKELNINAKVFSRAAINGVLDVGRRIGEADDGGLLDGIVVKTLRDWRRPKNE